MRLTFAMRKAFVDAVMADIPRVRYEDAITKLIYPDLLAHLPAPVRALYDDPETRSWVRLAYGYFYGVRVAYPSHEDVGHPRHLELLSEKTKAACAKLASTEFDEALRRDELRKKLTSVVAGCQTTQLVRQLLPELASYLPEEVSKTKNLPALRDITEDLTRAGWKKKKAA